MIISFTVKNWMSFRDETTFSMVASRERQHGERVSFISKYKTKILPITAIYGGNASGKTNLFKALSFVKKFVTRNAQLDSLIPVEPFLLGSSEANQPSSFSMQLLIEEAIYEFSFKVTRSSVLEEKLVKISSTSEKTLYERLNNEIEFDPSLRKQENRLKVIFEGTTDNRLFLTNSVFQKIQDFRPVYNWFKETLHLIDPYSKFASFEHLFNEDHPLYLKMNKLVSQLDTGISQLGGDDIPYESLPISKEQNEVIQEMNEGDTFRLLDDNNGERYVVIRKEGKLFAKKLVFFHHKADGALVKFDIDKESDGSKQVIELLPAFILLAARLKHVVVIDEIDRSLHTHLIWQLLQAYLFNCSADSRSQLLFTTHNVLLMDQDLFRRDEIWVTERDNSNASAIISFCEYKDVRSDKDIRKSYLQGRLGGLPRIFISGESIKEQQ